MRISNLLIAFILLIPVIAYSQTKTYRDGSFSSLIINNTTPIYSILDEDNMASDRDDALATQQSIKNYVDSNSLTLIDDDSFTNATSSNVASAESIKAYVDSISSANLVQTVFNSTNSAVTVAGDGIPYDDTIPASNEGTELAQITTDITPTSTDNKLRFTISINWTVANADEVAFVLADDTTTVATFHDWKNVNNQPMTSEFTHIMNVPATTAKIYRVRMGTVDGDTIYINSSSTGRKFGGTMYSSMIIEEISP